MNLYSSINVYLLMKIIPLFYGNRDLFYTGSKKKVFFSFLELFFYFNSSEAERKVPPLTKRLEEWQNCACKFLDIFKRKLYLGLVFFKTKTNRFKTIQLNHYCL